MAQVKLDCQSIREYVLGSLSEGQLISVYFRKNAPDRFLVGQVMAWPDGGPILLRLVSLEGEFDGYLLYRPEDIYRYEWNDHYLQELSQKLEKHNTRCSVEDFFAMSKKKLVEILGHNGNCLARGFLLQIKEQLIRLQRMRTDGSDGAACKYFLKNIGGIICDSKDTRRLLRLHEEGTPCKQS